MKLWSKIILLCALLSAIGIVPQSQAAIGCSAMLVWEPSPSTGIAGYAVYYGVSGSDITNRFDAGPALSATITGLTPATTYFFYVVVYDSYGDESPPSNVLLYTTPLISALQLSQTNGTINIQFQVTPDATCSVEYSPSLSQPSWTLLTTDVADSNGFVSVYDTIDPTQPIRFYRGVISSQLPVPSAPQVSATGITTTLQWDAGAGSTTAGYIVYYGAVGSLVTNQVNVGLALSANISGLSASTPYFFYVVSYDSSGNQSPPSNLVLYTTPQMSPLQISQLGGGTINIQFTTVPQTACVVEFTPSLIPPNWNILAEDVADATGLVSINDTVDPSQPTRFYRAVIEGQVPPQLTATTLGPATVLQWNSSASPSVIGWAVYYGVAGSFTNRLDVGWAIAATIDLLNPSTTYFFYVVSYDVFGNESAPSNVIQYTTPSLLPLLLGPSRSAKIQFTVPPGTACDVKYPTSLNPPTWPLLSTALRHKRPDAIHPYDRWTPVLSRLNPLTRFRIA